MIWASFQRIEYDVDFSVEQPYDEFCKASSYSYQNEFRIALDLAKGRFNPEQLKDVTDFALLTFRKNRGGYQSRFAFGFAYTKYRQY